MNHIHSSTATLLAALSLLLATPKATAQIVINPDRAQGLFSTWATGVSVRAPGTNPIQIRAPGVSNDDPIPWDSAHFSPANADHPDYSIPALRASWLAGSLSSLPTPEFGDISTGNDLMPWVDQGGYLDMNGLSNRHWYALTVAVASNAVGVSPQSIIGLRVASPHGNAVGDILSYYAIGSEEIATTLVDTVRLESSREQLHLGALSTSNQNIVNLDYGLAGISVDPNNLATVTFPVRRSFYFTLAKNWLTSPTVAAAIANTTLKVAGAAPNASTVYVMTWSMTPTPGWSAPALAFKHADLFPGIAVGCVEIDAISVDEGSGGPTNPRALVFSMTPQSDFAQGNGSSPARPFDQILVYTHDSTGATHTPTLPLRTDPNLATGPNSASTLVSDRLGLRHRGSNPTTEPDNVTSTCGIDPQDGHAIQPVVGLASDQGPQGQGDLGLSVFRTCPGHDDGDDHYDILRLQVTGLQDVNTWPLHYVYVHFAGSINANSDLMWVNPNSTTHTVELTYPVSHTTGMNALYMDAWLNGVDFTDPDNPVGQPVRQSWVITLAY